MGFRNEIAEIKATLVRVQEAGNRGTADKSVRVFGFTELCDVKSTLASRFF
ncbi:MAG: hypothetical protein WC568_05470 [Candidatus Methanoperedens sp.]